MAMPHLWLTSGSVSALQVFEAMNSSHDFVLDLDEFCDAMCAPRTSPETSLSRLLPTYSLHTSCCLHVTHRPESTPSQHRVSQDLDFVKRS
eukprot:2615588-Prymnesium_polylepis.1